MEGTGVKGQRVLFDVLKERSSASFHRHVQDTKPPGCAWQSLAMALHNGFGHQDVDKASKSGELLELERELRRLLVHSYQALSPKELRFVAEAKLQCELSFFKHAGYLEVEETLQHWKWYLYCLTFDSHSFTESSLKGWSVVPRTPLKGAFVVRMPLDSVDLAIFAQLLDVQILLFQLFQPALRFGAGETLHLLTHGGLWAPLLSSKQWLQEKSDLCGSVVEIDRLGGPLAHLAGKSACILSYDVENDCHIAATCNTRFPLKSVQISRILARPEDGLVTHGRCVSRMRGTAFRGIPDSSIDFQILSYLIRLDVGQRLDDLHEELAGRCRRPVSDYCTPNKHVPSGHPNELCTSTLPLQQVLEMLSEGTKVWTKCLAAVGPKRDKAAEFLTCRIQDFICLEKALDEDPLAFLAHTASDPQAKQISMDIVCSWLVLEDYLPRQAHPRSHELLELREGDAVLVSERQTAKWHGWARGRRLQTSEESRKKEGLFPMAVLRPRLWIAKIESRKELPNKSD